VCLGLATGYCGAPQLARPYALHERARTYLLLIFLTYICVHRYYVCIVLEERFLAIFNAGGESSFPYAVEIQEHLHGAHVRTRILGARRCVRPCRAEDPCAEKLGTSPADYR
jgi:hypothetical protein